MVLAAAGAEARGQGSVPITGDRLSGFVLPIEPLSEDIEIEALRVRAWDVDDTRRLLLEGDVRVRIGARQFTADTALVWINRLPSEGGLINQLAVFFDRVRDPTKRAGFGVGGRHILVTASARGAVTLEVGLLDPEPPPPSRFIERGEQRLADHLRRLLAHPPPLGRRPRIERPEPPASFRPQPGREIRPSDVELPTEIDLPPLADPTPPIFEPRGTVRFSAAQIDVNPGAHETTITAFGSVVLEYVSDRSGEWSHLALSAERAVIFADPGSIKEMFGGQLASESIRGVYLEGNVVATADEREYTVRAPQMYYDFRTNEAIMLDAVLRTYSRPRRLAIYARAEEMRQLAANQWSARRVRVSTSDFFTPHLSIGAARITLTRRPEDPETGRRAQTHLDSRHNTLEAGGWPFFYWPGFSGTIDNIPLRAINVGTRDNDGLRIETEWNPYALLGLETPLGIDATLRLDAFTNRGGAVGLDFIYGRGSTRGALDLYGLYDEGVDRTSSGREVEHDDGFRGIALWEQRMELGRSWTLLTEAAWISDETFVSAWREEDFGERREYQTSVYLKYQRDNAALTFLGKYDLNDFISNSDLLASRQYQVEKLPEVTYRRYGDSWFGDTVTYSGETRLGRVRFSFDRSTPRELGVPAAAFGPTLGDDDQLSAALRARGFPADSVTRFDTRHEIVVPFQWGAARVAPFLVGRFTAYDQDFDAFSPQGDQTRVFGAAGMRLTARFQRVDNRVESRLFDLHRLRHIVEPRLLLWFAHSNVSDDDLPVYDEAVESIGTGGVVVAGVRNVWQTQRGGPGRWRSVDVLTIDAALTLDTSDTNRESPTPQFFEYRPEYSQFGDHASGSLVWRLSDSFSVLGEGTYDLVETAVARGSIGVEMRHSPLLSTFFEFRYIDASDNQLLAMGWNYRITPKYAVSLRPEWDFHRDEFRAVDVSVTRSFPDFDFIVRVRHDEIRDDTIIGASLGRVAF